MDFGVNSSVWVQPVTNEALKRLIPHVAEAGFDLIEITIESINDIDYPTAAAVLRHHNIGVSVCPVMQCDRNIVDPDPARRDSCFAFLCHCIEATAQLGGSNMIGPFYFPIGRFSQGSREARPRAFEMLVQQLRGLAEYAAAHGVVLCIEPVNRFESSFLNVGSQAIELVDRVAHPSCQILLDTFHMNIEEESLGEAIRIVGPRLREVHASENHRGIPGRGHIPWDEVAAALRDIEYDGPIVIEGFTDQVKVVADAMAIWRPLASSGDALAVQGLAFLKQLLV